MSFYSFKHIPRQLSERTITPIPWTVTKDIKWSIELVYPLNAWLSETHDGHYRILYRFSKSNDINSFITSDQCNDIACRRGVIHSSADVRRRWVPIICAT